MNRQLISRSYLQVATQTASRGQLVLMLYEGAIRFLERALGGFAIDDPAECNETINNNIQRAQAILDELNSALNVEDGGELADRLRALYHYMDERLQTANLKKTTPEVEEVIVHLTTLRDAWREMLCQDTAPDEARLSGLAVVG
ncbi:MAG: flagellar export chaperone FliS [Verrucomicrobiales bacterium]|nr:flagellar export chaperone FliS [Verrucomicrobiales bacterium]